MVLLERQRAPLISSLHLHCSLLQLPRRTLCFLPAAFIIEIYQYKTHLPTNSQQTTDNPQVAPFASTSCCFSAQLLPVHDERSRMCSHLAINGVMNKYEKFAYPGRGGSTHVSRGMSFLSC